MQAAASEHEMREAHKRLIRVQRSIEAFEDEIGSTYQSVVSALHSATNFLPPPAPPPQHINQEYHDPNARYEEQHYGWSPDRMPNVTRNWKAA